MDTAELVMAAQNGSQQAIEELYTRYIGEIQTIARGFFPNEYDAEDAASEIFLLVMQKIHKVEHPELFRSWLKKVAARKCISILRKKHEDIMEDEDFIENECNTTTGDFQDIVPHEKLDNLETQRMIFDMICELSEKHKTVILMYYYSNMSVESIAKSLHISEGTVKSRLSYARDKLEKKILAYEKQGIKLYNINILNHLEQIISNIAQNTQVTTNFSAVMNTLANSSSGVASAVSSSVSTMVSTQVSNTIGTSIAHTVSNATATRISVIASAATIAVCTAVTQLPPTDAQTNNEFFTVTSVSEQLSDMESSFAEPISSHSDTEPYIVYRDREVTVDHEVTVPMLVDREVPVDREVTVEVPVKVPVDREVPVVSIQKEISTIIQKEFIETPAPPPEVTTITETSIITEISTITETNIVYMEVEKPKKDYSKFHYDEDDMLRYKIYDSANEAEIIEVKRIPQNPAEVWELPDTFEEIPITKIGRELFKLNRFPDTTVNTIKIGANVEEIRKGAFSNCDFLKAIELNDKITEIAPKTFQNCQNLETVTGGTNVEIIGELAFDDTALKNLDFSTALKSIEENAFQNCHLEKAVFPETMEYIDEWTNIEADDVTFYIDTDKAGETLYTERYNSMLSSAKTVNIVFTGNSVKSRSNVNALDDMFDCGFEYRTLHISLADSITEIEQNAFCNCTMEEITLPKNLKTIEDYTFDNCTNLKNITLNEGLQSIGVRAFSDCTTLTNIIIPESVAQIGDEAFNCCYSLESITIPDSVKTIGESAFWSCEALKSVTLSNSLETIGDCAFLYCTSLKEITIPESVVQIGKYAFDDTCTIYGTAGSYAQQYAEENHLTFVPVTDEPAVSPDPSLPV